MIAIISKIFLIIIIILQISCSNKDQTYDKNKAIIAFNQKDQLAISKSAPIIKLEEQISAKSWNFIESNHQNGRIGNFFKDFNFKKNKFYFKDYHKIILDYSLRNKDLKLDLPVIINDKLFILDNNAKLSLIDLNSNKKIWQKQIFKKDIFEFYNNPKLAGDNSKLYAHISTNEIKAIDINYANIIWSKKLSSLIISKPVISDNLLYLLSDDNKLYAINTQNGKILWVHKTISNPTTISGAADPVIFKDYIIISYSSGEVFALNKKNGQEIWSDKLNSKNFNNSNYYLNDIDATPIIIKDKLYIIGNGGLMKAININSGKIIWHREISSINDFHINKNYIYLIDNNAKLISLSLSDAKIKWIKNLKEFKNNKKPNSKIIYNGIIMADNKLLVNSTDSNIIIISPDNGDILGEIKIGGSNFHSPIIINNKIYLMSKNWYSRYILSFK